MVCGAGGAANGEALELSFQMSLDLATAGNSGKAVESPIVGDDQGDAVLLAGIS